MISTIIIWILPHRSLKCPWEEEAVWWEGYEAPPHPPWLPYEYSAGSRGGKMIVRNVFMTNTTNMWHDHVATIHFKRWGWSVWTNLQALSISIGYEFDKESFFPLNILMMFSFQSFKMKTFIPNKINNCPSLISSIPLNLSIPMSP